MAKRAQPKRKRFVQLDGKRYAVTNIYARKTADGWRWRPALKLDGDLTWGPSFPTQEQAYRAFLAMRDRAAEVPKDGGPTLSEGCDRVVQALLEKGGSPHTATGYRARFKKWLEILPPDTLIHELDTDALRRLLTDRREQHGVRDPGIRQDIVVLRRLFNVCGLRGDRNPALGLEQPTPKEPRRHFLSLEQVLDAVSALRATGTPDAESAADMIEFLAWFGVRAFELSRIRSPDFEWSKNGGTLQVQSKRGGVRRVPFDAELKPLAKRLAARCKDGPICTPVQLATILKHVASVTGLPHLNARVLRRTALTDTYKSTKDLRTVQHLAGHRQLTTTQRYLGLSDDDVRDALSSRRRQLQNAQASSS